MKLGHLFLLVFIGQLQAAGLKPPMDFTSAKVLPKGVRNLRLRPVLTGANDRFDHEGRLEPVGSAMNSQVSFSRLIDGKPSVGDRGNSLGQLERAQLRSFLKSNGFNDLENAAGSTTGDVHVGASVLVPIVGYGVSKNWTLAAAIPVYQFQTQMKTGFVANAELERLGRLLVDRGMTKEYQELVKNMENPIPLKMQQFGYEPLANEKFSSIGDIKLVSKYLLSQKENISLSMQNDLTVPTGKKPNHNKLVDLSSGDGQWDVGLGMIGEWVGPKAITVASTVGIVAELPQTMARRIPEYPDSALSPDVDENTQRDLGDQIYSQVHGRWEFLEGLALSSALGYQYKQADHYSGRKFESTRYEWMEAKTEQYLVSAQLGLGANTIAKFMRKEFIAPLEAGLNYTHVLAGKNVAQDGLWALDLAMFF